MSNTDGAPKPKRRRLAVSCERCRSRKIRCDTEQPKCRPCAYAQAACLVPEGSTRMETGRHAPLTPSSASETTTTSSAHQALHDASNGLDSYNAASSALPTQPQISDIPYPAANESLSLFATMLASYSDPLDTRVNETSLLMDQDYRRKLVGPSSNQVLIRWLDQESTTDRLAPHFDYGFADVEEMTFPGLDEALAPFPEQAELIQYIDAFFKHTHLLYPCLSEQRVRDGAVEPSPLLTSGMMWMTSIMYLVISLGADSLSPDGRTTATGDKYLHLAWKSLPSILARPYRHTVQMLILLSLACHSRNKYGMSWNLIGYAARIALGLGLQLPHTGHTADVDARIWFCVYSIDKMHSLDTGRPSAIRDSDCLLDITGLSSQPQFVTPAFIAMVSLCQIVSGILTDLFPSSGRPITSLEALFHIGKYDAQLVAWAEQQPRDFRLTNDLPLAGPYFEQAVCVHFLYHQSLIVIHRLSLFSEIGAYLEKLEYAQLAPYATRLRNGRGICMTSARAVLAMLHTMSEAPAFCRLWSFHSVMTAIFALAVCTQKAASRWQAKADLSLLQEAIPCAVTHLERLNFDSRYVALLPALYKKIERRVEFPNLQSRAASRQASPETAGSAIPTTTGSASQAGNRLSLQDPWSFPSATQDYFPFVNMDVDDLASLLFGGTLFQDSGPALPRLDDDIATNFFS